MGRAGHHTHTTHTQGCATPATGPSPAATAAALGLQSCQWGKMALIPCQRLRHPGRGTGLGELRWGWSRFPELVSAVPWERGTGMGCSKFPDSQSWALQCPGSWDTGLGGSQLDAPGGGQAGRDALLPLPQTFSNCCLTPGSQRGS